jgi:2-C-methyl-D-erythritol 4-phosphate cytidylyltransferase
MSYYALIPAAGSGSRMAGVSGEPLPKQYLSLAGKPVIWHSLAAMVAAPAIERVFVVISPEDNFWPTAAMSDLGDKVVLLRCGGATRAQSVFNGLREMDGRVANCSQQWILVHDAARPCLTALQIDALIGAVGDDDAGGILAIPLADTLKRADDSERPRIATTVPREGLWQAQTPQMFRHHLLMEALDFAPQVTDEASAVEALGLHPRLIEGDMTNLKVTYPRDLLLAEWIMKSRSAA